MYSSLFQVMDAGIVGDDEVWAVAAQGDIEAHPDLWHRIMAIKAMILLGHRLRRNTDDEASKALARNEEDPQGVYLA